MSKLPQDIINDILTYLPFKSLIWFKSTSPLNKTPQSVEAASGGDEDNAVQELEYPEVISSYIENSWRKVPDHIGNGSTFVEAYQGILCNGTARWLGMQEIASKNCSGDVRKLLVCINLVNAMEAISRQLRTHDHEHDSKASLRR
ncbi:hypothetical protein H0E87_028460 [Populus deltoides]|uniref:F-box domain-containing protein n=1 Tax=Populus deltoides TaxID=3696 RepID=A0A8T2WRS4_POPDE|nr:hypothetical protein H0E87_028460 [Populus deltoides]